MNARTPARRWIVLGLGLAALGLTPAAPVRAADDAIDNVLVANGKLRFEQYCTPCHAAGGAPGNQAKKDLRTYVARNGGTFPSADWLEIIEDVRPGSVHTDVWERMQRDQGTSNADIAARGIVGQIARYVNSIQSKSK